MTLPTGSAHPTPVTGGMPGSSEEAAGPETPPASSGNQRAVFRNVLTALILAAVAGGVVWFVARPRSAGGASQSVSVTARASGPAPHVGSPAPDFTAIGLDGSSINLAAYRGHPVWITFWATWCPPCRAESPDIEAAYVRYQGQGLVVLAVNVGEDPGTVRDYVQRLGLTFPVVGDPTTDVAALYRVNGLPTHFFVDASGVLRDSRMGEMTPASIQQELARIIPAGGAASAAK